MTERRQRRLIEVAFPLGEVSEHSAHEKNVKQGHINMLHVWWARRPLAACRAFIYASLINDPDDETEREELLKEVADIASWDVIRRPDQVVRSKAENGSGFTGRQLLDRARQRILKSNGGVPPLVLDPFAGGGAIPLEALRLGCEASARDLNPVAALILKCTLEYPQTYGQPDSQPTPSYFDGQLLKESQKGLFKGDVASYYGRNPLVAEIRYWASWIEERATRQIGAYYAPDPDGAIPVAYLWSRTIPCPNCGKAMPLIRQYWLARSEKRNVALEPFQRDDGRVDFDVVEGKNISGDPASATTSAGDSSCLSCNQVVKAAEIRRRSRAGQMGSMLTAVVSETAHAGKVYRSDTESDSAQFLDASRELESRRASHQGPLSYTPDEPIARETLGLRIDEFGLDEWSKLYNDRQLLALATFSSLIREARDEMTRAGMDSGFADAVATYLAFILDRFANTNSSLARLMSAGARGIVGTFARQALSMVWDYAEANPFGTSASWTSARDAIVAVLEMCLSPSQFSNAASVSQADAQQWTPSELSSLVLADPPYYNAIDYAGLSDFFYVWLKRSLTGLHSDLLTMPLTPKREQAIMASESDSPEERLKYVEKMGRSFQAMAKSILPTDPLGVVFAHSDPDAWATLIEGLLAASLVPVASWPIDTELKNKTGAANRANLQTSVWMSCLPRSVDSEDAFLGDIVNEMQPIIRERLLYFWRKGIRGADFFISAIGPALSVFGRYGRVLRPSGEEVTVREFLDLVRRESTVVALEQVLHGADLGVVDAATRQYVTWVWSYSRAPLDTGEAIALCLATGADYGQIVRPHGIAVETKEKSNKVVKLRTVRERGQQDEDLGVDSVSRMTPLIDQLHYAAWLWSQNRREDALKHRAGLGETRWQALRTLGQAVVECLPDGDEDRRLINGLMTSNAMSAAAPTSAARPQPALGI